MLVVWSTVTSYCLPSDCNHGNEDNEPEEKEQMNKTRGPNGSWVAHLRKRSNVTVKPFKEDHKCYTLNIKALVDFYKKIFP